MSIYRVIGDRQDGDSFLVIDGRDATVISTDTDGTVRQAHALTPSQRAEFRRIFNRHGSKIS